MYAVKKGTMYVGIRDGRPFLGPSNLAATVATEAEVQQLMATHGLTAEDGYFSQRGYYVVRHPEDPSLYLHGTTDLRSTAVWAANKNDALQFPDENSARSFMLQLSFSTEAERAINSSVTLVPVLP